MELHTFRDGNLITINVAGTSVSAIRARQSRNLAIVGSGRSFNHEAGVLDVGLGLGVPGRLALVQVDRHGDGGEDADDDDHHEQLDKGKAFSPLARRLSALRTLFIIESFFLRERSPLASHDGASRRSSIDRPLVGAAGSHNQQS